MDGFPAPPANPIPQPAGALTLGNLMRAAAPLPAEEAFKAPPGMLPSPFNNGNAPDQREGNLTPPPAALAPGFWEASPRFPAKAPINGTPAQHVNRFPFDCKPWKAPMDGFEEPATPAAKQPAAPPNDGPCLPLPDTLEDVLAKLAFKDILRGPEPKKQPEQVAGGAAAGLTPPGIPKPAVPPGIVFQGKQWDDNEADWTKIKELWADIRKTAKPLQGNNAPPVPAPAGFPDPPVFTPRAFNERVSAMRQLAKRLETFPQQPAAAPPPAAPAVDLWPQHQWETYRNGLVVGSVLMDLQIDSVLLPDPPVPIYVRVRGDGGREATVAKAPAPPAAPAPHVAATPAPRCFAQPPAAAAAAAPKVDLTPLPATDDGVPIRFFEGVDLQPAVVKKLKFLHVEALKKLEDNFSPRAPPKRAPRPAAAAAAAAKPPSRAPKAAAGDIKSPAGAKSMLPKQSNARGGDAAADRSLNGGPSAANVGRPTQWK